MRLATEAVIVLTLTGILMGLSGFLYFLIEDRKDDRRRLFFKSLTTSFACLAAAFRLFSAGSFRSSLLLIFLGALCCAAADFLLEIRFLAGVIAFGLGHLFFLGALFSFVSPGWYTWLLFLLLYAAVFLIHRKKLAAFGSLLPALLIYAALLSLMAAAALTGLFAPRFLSPAAALVMALGGSSFFLSDNILAWRLLHEDSKGRGWSAAILIFYYGAVYLLCAFPWFL